jgi:hypothetical protein
MNLITNCEILEKKIKFWGILNCFLVGHVGRHSPAARHGTTGWHGPGNWARAVPRLGHQPVAGTARPETYSLSGHGPFKKARALPAQHGPNFRTTHQVFDITHLTWHDSTDELLCFRGCPNGLLFVPPFSFMWNRGDHVMTWRSMDTDFFFVQISWANARSHNLW